MNPSPKHVAAAVMGLIFALPVTNLAAEENLPPPLVAGVGVPQGQIEMAIERVPEIVNAVMEQTGVPGIAVAVVADGEVAYAEGFGVRRVGTADPVTPDTIFQIASLSKSIGASVVAHQVGTGVVDWDTPITELLPWFALSDERVTALVTIGDLFAHRSGLPDHAGDDLEDLGFDRRTILERLRYLPLSGFRQEYAYTNFGLTAAAEAVAAASGEDWADLSREVLYEPLGMSRTSSRLADFLSADNRAYGHVQTGQGYEPLFQREPDAQSPAGGVSSSVTDMANWLLMVLQDGVFEGRQIVADDALLPAISPQVISSPPFVAAARAGFYGYGFGVSYQPSGRVLLSHSGAFALGAATNYVMLPSLEVGIVILSNAAPIGAVEAIGMTVADLVQYGEVTRDWTAAYGEAMAPVMAPFGKYVGRMPPSDPAPHAPLQTYVGTYQNAYFGEVAITSEAGELALSAGPEAERFQLRHWTGDAFVFAPRGENATAGSISAASFRLEGDRSVSLTIEFFDAYDQGTFLRIRE